MADQRNAYEILRKAFENLDLHDSVSHAQIVS